MNDEEVRAVLGDSTAVMARLDRSGRLLKFVPGRGYVGRTPADLIGRSLTELLAAPDVAIVNEGIARALATNTALFIEHTRPSPIGPRNIRVRIAPSADGTLLAHIVDITDEVDARRKQQELIDSYGLLSRATTDAVFDWDMVSNRISWNERVTAVLGYAVDDVNSVQAWFDRVHPDGRDDLRATRQAAAADPTRDTLIAEYRFRAADGRFVDVIERAVILRDRGRAIRVVGALHDVTDTNRMKDRLLTADRIVALGTLAAGVAHEIKNPLNYVAGNAALAIEALRATPPQVARAIECLTDVEHGASQLHSIVGDLKALTRSDDKEVSAIDVRAVVELAVKMTRHELAARGVTVELAIADVPLVDGNAHRLEQVVVNLLVNAFQSLAQDEHGNRVRVSLVARGGEVVLEVEDTGRGIAPEHLPRLFDPFFTTKLADEGTGLGLSITHAIVASHGGHIEVDADRPRGSVFRVFLPVSQRAPAAQAVRAVSTPSVTARARVLVVDDDALTRQLVRRILDPEHDVVLVDNAVDALSAVASGDFDVVLSDVVMPGVDGICLYARVVASGRPVRFAFLTAGSRGDSAVTAGVPSLEKPFAPDALRQLVRRLQATPSVVNGASRLASSSR